MPINFSHNKSRLTMVADFLESQELPYAGQDGATFWIQDRGVAERLAGREGKVVDTKTPFGVLYTVSHEHIKARFGRGLRHGFNQRVVEASTTVFIMGYGKWYRIDATNGLELAETVQVW